MMLLTPVLIGLVAGVLSGLLGVGGGVVVIPILVLGFQMTQHLAQGVSLAVIIPTALTGLITFHRKGLIEYKMAGLLAAGSMAGILISGNFVHLIPSLMLKKVFGGFLALIGLRMLMNKNHARQKNNDPRKMEDNDGKE